ncbi:Fc.00g040300.m01.CDS01 [Cosmosporella sp. VM-42]
MVETQETMPDQPENENPLTGEFGDFVKDTLKEWKVPGVSIAVIDGEDVYAEGYGFATLPDTTATPETIWYGASTTKAFVAATLAHLIDTKAHPLLSKGWSTPISSIIQDDFVLQDVWATNHLTLDDAVSHRTGMPRHDKSIHRVLDGKQTTVRDVVRNLRNLPVTEEPRVKFQYCNLMYVVLSHVIETVTGKGLGDVMKESIWEPLGMSSTYFDLDIAKAAPEHLASGYYWDDKTEEYHQVPDMPVVEVSGAGAIFSNALDYAKWVKCLLHETAPFSEASHKDIRTPRMMGGMPAFGNDISMYSLGWERTLYRGHVMYKHSGGMHAFGSQVYWLPDAKFGVVAFANTSLTSNAAEDVLAFRLIHEKLGIKSDELNRADIWHGIIDKWVNDYNKAIDIVYPERSDPPLPPTVSPKELAGSYYDAGYKEVTLRVEPHPDKSDEEILVVDRKDTTWKSQMRLHHVSGDWWILYIVMADNPGLMFREYVKAEFKIGPSGRPTGLEVEWWARTSDMYEGTTLFKRVD